MKSISDSKRSDVLSLLNSGHNVAEVVCRVKVSKATVCRIGKIACPDRKKVKGGRPSKLTIENKRYCVQKITKGGLDNAIQIKEELSRNLKINVSGNTVRRTLRNNGLGALPKVKKPDISADNAKERLLWFNKDKIDWTLDNWKRVIFTDESRVNYYNSDGRVWCWKGDNEEVQPRHNTKKIRKHGGGRIMIWSGISWSGLRRDQVILQQDNDPKHTSKLMKDHFKTKKYEVMSWRARSSDLKPIETMWRLLKISLNEYDTLPKGMNDLWERTREVWYEKITVEECQKVMSSMPYCVEACIKAKGYGIDY
ncbi:hypothetical protein INT46_003736 [Mucor plumbeus]|uniref:Transposase Tc1-like domain-containing protein n=1 Tax=Mucor plumbeus TaxID=97098 RepID=A0A8H7QB72_9FUNG|nr:hypothetical protein INT46_003736 [Mucor plumbeus]